MVVYWKPWLKLTLNFMLINPGSVINKLFKIYFNKNKFYASKWRFTALKILKNQELRPPDPPTGAYGPLEPCSFMV